ncbi:MAG TPA: hypothetical protein VID07_10805, partial [Actinomycetes bacterium]
MVADVLAGREERLDPALRRSGEARAGDQLGTEARLSRALLGRATSFGRYPKLGRATSIGRATLLERDPNPTHLTNPTRPTHLYRADLQGGGSH